MSQSFKKAPFVSESLLKKINKCNVNKSCGFCLFLINLLNFYFVIKINFIKLLKTSY